MGRTLLAILFFSVACSSSGNTSSGTVAAGKDDFIAKLCDLYMPCCAKTGKPADGAQCRAFYGAFTSSGSYDGAAGNACLSEVKAQSSSPTFCDTGMSSSSSPSCAKVFSTTAGVKKPGEECSQDSDCAPSSEGTVDCRSLFTSGGATIKKCQIQIKGKAGDSPCLGTVDGNVTSYNSSGDTDVAPRGYLCNVADGLRCDSTTDKCTAIPKIGEACTSSGSNSCTKDAYCDTTMKTCVAKKMVGAMCSTFGDECAAGLYCNSTTKVCTTAIADGAPCKTSSECISRSCVNSACAKTGSSNLTTAFLCGGG